MPGITLDHVVAAPRERVWAVFTDLELAVREVEGIREIERIDGAGFQVGTKWRETRVMFGREATEVMWVTAAEEPERYVVEAESSGAHYRTEYRFTEVDGGTRVDVAFSAEPTTSVAKMLTPLTFKAMRKNLTAALSADCEALAAVAERGA